MTNTTVAVNPGLDDASRITDINITSDDIVSCCVKDLSFEV